MNGIIAFILGIFAILVIIGASFAVIGLHEGVSIKDIVNKFRDKSSEAASSDSSSSGGILSEHVEENGQEGGGSYRQVDYADGGFRQYDTKTGDLIGSSYESDQGKLPSIE